MEMMTVVSFIFLYLFIGIIFVSEISFILYELKINLIISCILELSILLPIVILLSASMFDILYLKYSIFNLISLLVTFCFLTFCALSNQLTVEIKNNCVLCVLKKRNDAYIDYLYTLNIILIVIIYISVIYFLTFDAISS